jgi:hypothetical protein
MRLLPRFLRPQSPPAPLFVRSSPLSSSDSLLLDDRYDASPADPLTQLLDPRALATAQHALEHTPSSERLAHRQAILEGFEAEARGEINPQSALSRPVSEKAERTVAALKAFAGAPRFSAAEAVEEMRGAIQAWPVSTERRTHALHALEDGHLQAKDLGASVASNPPGLCGGENVGLAELLALVLTAIEKMPAEGRDAAAQSKEKGLMRETVASALGDSIEHGRRVCVDGIFARLAQSMEVPMGTGGEAWMKEFAWVKAVEPMSAEQALMKLGPVLMADGEPSTETLQKEFKSAIDELRAGSPDQVEEFKRQARELCESMYDCALPPVLASRPPSINWS